jgi:pyruvate dehydrogenase E2 component (dihydrolipoamide acetyltransferase)
VIAADVLRFEAGQAFDRAELPKIKETLRLTPMRRAIAERMAKSKQTAPHFYVSIDVDMTEITTRRTALRERREAPVPSINDYIVAASARSLRDFPALNAAFTENGIEIYSDINLGLAMALEDGLVVPVIRNADRLSVHEIAMKSRELAEKAQSKKLFPSDYAGGTFTVSNLGMFGVDSFVAVINPPQCAILAVGRVAPRVIAQSNQILVRSMMTATLSADHRITDGVLAARFLNQLKELLERGLS